MGGYGGGISRCDSTLFVDRARRPSQLVDDLARNSVKRKSIALQEQGDSVIDGDLPRRVSRQVITGGNSAVTNCLRPRDASHVLAELFELCQES